ncbi:AzlD domain-containing protein [Aquisalimonas sp.]|uniref:AzlD domain-containing protein n=1 Tax=Aquisalimonas sp. TaxID=1872621 RepID=UPI0025C0DF03|nr:AzlD domain-containing protein [Aquisalimonas sp.]
MSLRPEVLLAIALCVLVTVIPRILPLALARRMRLPPLVEAWLTYVPVAVIAALLVDQVLLVGDGPGITWSWPHVSAGVTVVAIAAASRSITLTVVGGVVVFSLAQALV